MKIRELYIAEFGGIKNQKIVFDTEQGLNIIYGENESGKSTIFLFIKFMLYGLQRKTQNNSERERSLSWSGSVAAGSMIIEHNGKEYRIERNFSDRAKGEKVFILSLESGTVLLTDKIRCLATIIKSYPGLMWGRHSRTAAVITRFARFLLTAFPIFLPAVIPSLVLL